MINPTTPAYMHGGGDPDFPSSLAPYPDNNPKSAMGAKKPPTLSVIPSTALLHLGLAMKNGAEKYGAFNFRGSKIAASVYADAAFRHLASWSDGEDLARDSKVHHLAHVMACCAIALDAMEHGMLLDDRPRKGRVANMIENYNENGYF